MISRGFQTRGRVHTEYYATALDLQRNAQEMLDAYRQFNVQIAELHPLILESLDDQFSRGLVSERISRWLLDISTLLEYVDVTVKKVDVAVQMIPRQKELINLVLKDPYVAATYGLATSGSSLSAANMMFFIVEADDIKISLSQAARHFHELLNAAREDAKFMEAWYQWLELPAARYQNIH